MPDEPYLPVLDALAGLCRGPGGGAGMPVAGVRSQWLLVGPRRRLAGAL
ncbi:MAG: hypothetical protein ACRDNT_10180 [Streptosporangiaceae bacterium]